MSLSLKRLAGDTIIYGASTMVGRLLNWLLMPFYIRILTTQEYGVIVNLYGIISILLVIFTYGLETGFFRFARKENVSDVFKTSVVMLSITSFLLIIFNTFFSNLLSCFFYDGKYRLSIILVGIIIGFDAFLSIPFARLRLQNKSLRFGIIKLVSILLNIGFNLFFFIVLPHIFKYVSYNGVIKSIYNNADGVVLVLLSNALSSVFIFFFFIKDLLSMKGIFNKTLLRPILNYSWPVLIVGITGMITLNIDKILMPSLIQKDGFKELAIYGANFKIGVLMSLFTQSFRFAFEPYFFNNRDKGVNSYAQIMSYFVFFGFIIFLGITIFQDLINVLLIQDYFRGNIIIPLILLAQLCYGIYFNLSLWYKLTDNTIYGAIFGCVGMVITVVLNLFLVPIYGMIGAAFALFFGYCTMMVISYLIGQKHYPIPYSLKIIGSFSFVAFIIFSINYLYVPDQIFFKYLFKIALFISFPLIFYFKKDSLFKFN